MVIRPATELNDTSKPQKIKEILFISIRSFLVILCLMCLAWQYPPPHLATIISKYLPGR